MEVSLFLRACSVFVFAYAAWSDHRTRTAPNAAWGVLLLLGIGALSVDLYSHSAPVSAARGVAIVIVGLSSLSLFAWRAGAIGGADAKAVMLIPVVFPKLPGQALEETTFGTLTQGVEGLMLVWVVAGIVGLWWPVKERLGHEQSGIPFLIPIAAAVLSLFAVSFV